MQKRAQGNEYKSLYEPLPVKSDEPIYYDSAPIELPYMQDFPYLHYHDRYEIGVCTEGNGLFLCEDRFYSVSTGDLIFVTKNARHYSRSLSAVNPFKCRFLYVSPRVIAELIGNEAEKVNIPSVISAAEHPKISALFGEIFEICSQKQDNLDKKIALRVAAFLLDADSHFPSAVKSAADEFEQKRAPEKEAEKVAQFIALHYSESHSTEELARLVHISASQLRRQFLASYGLPPVAYRGKLRVGIAAVLLLRTKLSVSQIAEQVGYNSASDFYRIFIKRYGMSPSEYRKEALR